ncbi:hypothetical protein THAOC_01934, partial [Thalassiosira oceanica]
AWASAAVRRLRRLASLAGRRDGCPVNLARPCSEEGHAETRDGRPRLRLIGGDTANPPAVVGRAPLRHNGRGAGILPRDGREVGGDRHGPLAGQPELDTAGDRAGEVPQEDRREDVRGVLVPALLEAEGALREGGMGDHRLRGVRVSLTPVLPPSVCQAANKTDSRRPRKLPAKPPGHGRSNSQQPEGIQIPVRNVHREEGRRVSHVEVRQRQGTGRRDGTGRHREGERIPETGDVRPEPRGGRATPRGRGGLSVGLGEGRRFGKPDRERPGIAGGPRASLMLH